MSNLTQKQSNIHERLQSDLAFYARHALKIKDKDGLVVPFIFNKAQRHIHSCLQKQLKDTGKVRALILKGRQQGCSTYVAARFYHQATMNKGKSVFILSHESETTDKLFRMVERYNENNNPALKPPTDISNRRKLKFGGGLDSEYFVGTAGNKNIGLGGTVQLFHGSEVAFWQNTDDIRTGLMQSISGNVGSEILLESTANGMDAMFYSMCMQALEDDNAERNGLRRKSEYKIVFTPWFWEDGYRKKVDGFFSISEEDEQYQITYDIEDEQMYWRQEKINELGGLWKFKKDYPANIIESFHSSADGLILPAKIVEARKCEYKEDKSKPLIIGVDPAREGDRTAIVHRRGRVLEQFHVYESMNEMLLAGILAKQIDTYNPIKMFIDVGLGYGTIDRLKELGYQDIVTGVHFGERAIDPDMHRNKRSQIYCDVKEWIEDTPCNIPDDDELHADLAIIPYFKESSNHQKYFDGKDKIKQDAGISPDLFEALALTFAYPVNFRTNNSRVLFTKATNNKSSIARFRKAS